MPELPEVETIRRGLSPNVNNHSIQKVTLFRHNLRYPFPPDFATKLQGLRITDIRRKGKFLLFNTEASMTWIVHLGMSGRIRWCSNHQTVPKQKHDHVFIHFNHGHLVYNDARRFGMMDCIMNDHLYDYKPLQSMGPDPISDTWDSQMLHQRILKRKTSIKSALMDQTVIAGIGNIYASESLYWAGIHPERLCSTLREVECQQLLDAIRYVLNLAIESGGSSLRDYRTAAGDLGYFQHHWAVYDRMGNPCPRSLTADPALNHEDDHRVVKITQAGRSSFYCAICQKQTL